MKILIGSLHHETNSFSPEIISYENWVKEAYREGPVIKELYYQKPHAIGGMLQALEDSGVDCQVLYGLDMTRYGASGGVADQRILDVFIEKMIAYVRENSPVDGILLSLHGAMQTTGCDDPEGAIIQALREAAGENVLIAASTDLHGYISDLMIENADIITGYHTYPHVDQYETGYRAAKLMLQKYKGQPLHMVKARIPMLVPASVYSTNAGPFAKLQEYAKKCVADNMISDYTIYQMQPWLDVEVGGSAVIVIGEDTEKCESVCVDLAERLLDMRHALKPDQKSIDEVIDIALENTTGQPVIIVDCADSPNAGASGDSMEVASRILARDLQIPSATLLIDRPAVAKAFEVGVGNKAIFKLGATIDPTLTAIEAEGYVRSLHTGEFRCEGPAYRGMVQQLGRTAVIRFGKMDVLVAENIVCPGDPQIYRAFGIEPTLYGLVDVKACTSFRMAYTKFTDLIYETDTQGSAAVNLKRLDFKRLDKEGFWPWNELNDYQIHQMTWNR